VLPAATSESTLLAELYRLNADDAVDGILVQLPLPSQIRQSRVLDAIRPDKDVDGFHPTNAGLLASGRPSLVPCTPRGAMKLLNLANASLEGAHAVVVGRSNIVGKPMAQLLLAANATVTVAHSRTKNLAGTCRQADVLVAAVGKAELVRGDWVKPGAIVIDVGMNRIHVTAAQPGETSKTKLVGDVAFDEVKEHAAAITPVPGGVGPMTIACLLENTLIAAQARLAARG
jgi:methylenetetrahydrofolate dehydrogenase (NADP+)/methenyltetrahydrofolate cyclohydrolase